MRTGRHLQSRRAASLQRHANAIDRDVESSGADRAAGGPPEAAAAGLPDLQVVLRVERERVPDDDATAGAERKAIEVRILLEIARHAIHHAIQTERRITKRQTADLGGRRDVALDQAGRHPSTSAMLSNPAAASSGGSSALTSTSSAIRSRMTLVYSVRLRRCSAGAPGSD